HVRPVLRRRAHRAGERVGQRDGADRDRRIDPARERLPGRGAGRRDRADGDHRRLRQHPRPERTRPRRRVREGRPRRGRTVRPLRRMNEQHTFLERLLDKVEIWGNKMPDPAILFLLLCAFVILLSQVLFWFDVKATYEVVQTPPTAAEETYY